MKGSYTHSAVKFDLVVHICGKKKLGREEGARMDVFSCKESQGIRFGGGKESHRRSITDVCAVLELLGKKEVQINVLIQLFL